MGMENVAGNSDRQPATSVARTCRQLEAARGYLALGMAGHALKELAAIRDRTQHRFEQFQLRGDALRLQERWCEALPAYTRALAERPDAVPVLLAAADCCRRLGEIERAIAATEEANRLRPDEPAILFAMARYHLIDGDVSQAFRWLGNAIRRCPDIAAIADEDPDFEPIRHHPRFQRWLAVAAARLAW